MVQQNYFQICI